MRRVSGVSEFCWLLMLCCLLTRSAVNADEPVKFNRDVRPILSDKCFYCHGPDASKRQGDLNLSSRKDATAGEAIIPGKPDESGVIRRVLSQDPEVRMPPESAKLGQLTDSETAILRRWIEQGAEYEDHWSFIPLPVHDTGAAPNAVQVAERIDQIVAAGLAGRGLTMRPEADRQTLIRRLSFDLTGLPPGVTEVDAFVSDTGPDAYRNLVDRLLSSPHYGERMAVDWLDTARYSDSFGFQVDREREMWPWRDWVIRSLNANLPFDQFVTWQLAGDLLPNPTDEQILATAFNRLHQQEAEGGSVEEEYRVEYVCDRVQTFATTFLGLTFECARCHDHKYDPVTQKEYYQLFSMFQNIDEAGLYSFFTQSPPTPAFTMADDSAKAMLARLQATIDEQEARATEIRGSRQADFEKWLDSAERQTMLIGLPELGRFDFEVLDQGKLANLVAADQPAVLKGENRLVAGRDGQVVEFTGDDPVDLSFGNFRREEPFSVSLWLKTPDVKDRAVIFHRSRAWTDAASRGYELLIEDGRLKWSLIHFWPGNAASVRAVTPLIPDEWTHVTVSSDGSSRAAGLQLWVNGRLAETGVVRDNLNREITGGGGDNISLGERFRDRGFKGGQIDDFRVFSRELTEIEKLAVYRESDALAILHRPTNQLTSDERNQLLNLYLASDSAWQSYLGSLRSARAETARFRDGLKEIMVMQELPVPKKAWVLFRGEYAQRREEVTGGTPAALSPFPADAPKNRLGLARWLTSPQHPLMARVTVNRIWQTIFGRGLVKTAEDFGSQGARPLYPDLLDALAVHLIQSGWDLKDLLRTIVMSKVYRQSSLADDRILSEDPENEWLARGPRFRLSAEMIRDNALACAGLLNRSVGGPPVNPYEMTESFKPAAAGSGDAVYRRSLYTNWRRTGPPPALMAFDAPRRAVCTAKRERTESPLQALILLNGVQYVEAARVLGEALHRETGGNLQAMVELGCRRCLGRQPNARECEIWTQLYQDQRRHFETHQTDAEKLLKIGHCVRDTTIPATDAAAAAMLAQAMLNHYDCVMKR